MRSFLLSTLVVLAVAPAAAAAEKYRIAYVNLGRQFPSSTWFWSSNHRDNDTMRNIDDRIEMLVMATGPKGGQAVRRLEVRITGLSCPRRCRDKSWSLKLPGGITQSGRAGRTAWVPVWGCGKPVVRARVQLKDGSHSRWLRWKPNTVCD